MVGKLKLGLILCFAFLTILVKGQNEIVRKISLNEAITLALQNNPLVKNSELMLQATQTHKRGIIDLPGTSVDFHYGQINSALKDKYIEINQSLGSIPEMIQKNKVVKNEIKVSESQQQLIIRDMVSQVKTAWFHWIFALQNFKLLNSEVENYDENLHFLNDDSISQIRDTATIEMLELQTKYAEIQNLLFQASENYKSATNQMLQLLFVEEQIQPFDTTLELYSIEVKTAGPDKFYPFSIMDHYSRISNLKQAELNLEKAKLFPEISFGYFNQEIDHVKGFQAVTAGLTIPLWFYPQKARIKEAQIMHKISLNDLEYNKFTMQKKIEDLRGKLDQIYIQISFYRENVLIQCEMLEKIIREKFKNKLIGDSEYMHNINTINNRRIEYLEKIQNYNTTAVELEYYVK